MTALKIKKPTDRQIQINKTYHSFQCNVDKTAKHFNITRNSVVKILLSGAIRGLIVMPDKSSPVAPPGWSSVYKTVQYNGKDEIIQTWDRLKPEEQDIEKFWKYLEQRTPVSQKIIQSPEDFEKHLCLEWKLMDHHLGMHSWAQETGNDYNIKIARKLIIKAAQKIYTQNVAKTIIVFGGDNLHADNRSGWTEKSKNSLDMDTRYDKILDCMEEAMLSAIEIAASVSKEVLVIVLSGNHDWHASKALSRILRAHYKNIPHITIDTSPAKHRFTYWGNTSFMFTHGDTGSDKRFATFFLNYLLEHNVTNVKRKLIRRGHDHTARKIVPQGLVEEDGVFIEHFTTLAPRDAYAYEGAYTNTRATVIELHHDKYGQVGRREIGIMELMED